MCGIFGYVGTERSVTNTVGKALKSLEYRGYDSWGIVWKADQRLETVKKIGKVPTSFTFDAMSRIAVGHTRWATHGGVTDSNAHPHLDSTGRVAIVHNGIVENAVQLQRELPAGLAYQSETDSEVIAHLLGERVNAGESIVDALRNVFPRLAGQNAVIAIDQHSEVIAAAMNVSPLVVGMGADGACIASDPFALAGKASSMIIAPNGAVIRLDADGITAISYDGQQLPLPDAHEVPDASIEELGIYSHFMTKEMSEQATVLRRHLQDIESSQRLADQIAAASQVVLTGCGSAFYAARIGASWLGNMAGRRAIAVPASEFDDVAPFMEAGTLVISITQSGETADVLEAMRNAQALGARLVTITNVIHSSAARLADDVVSLDAGRERSVLATKSLLAMLSRLLAASYILEGRQEQLEDALRQVAATLDDLWSNTGLEEFISSVSDLIAKSEHVYVIGKGDGYGVAQEAALKIKEASYVHAEAFAAGELKHGAIALIEPGTPCLVFTTNDRFVTDTSSTAQELHSRGGYTIGIGLPLDRGVDQQFTFPDHGPANALVQIFVAQSLAYRVAIQRNLDPDYPRNLAKSVTVK
jgi:glucosamine--fructose-6-phosphate aminotransferase (isomerizing)